MKIKIFAGDQFSRNCIHSFWLVQGAGQKSVSEINSEPFKKLCGIPTKEGGKTAFVYHDDLSAAEKIAAGYELINEVDTAQPQG